jgi:hypothetical protein
MIKPKADEGVKVLTLTRFGEIWLVISMEKVGRLQEKSWQTWKKLADCQLCAQWNVL